MTLVSEIILDAYRESNILAIGTDPTTAQQTEALRFLNRLVSSVYGDDAGEQLEPFPIGRNNIDRPQGFPWYDETPDFQDWFIPQNTQLVLNLTSPVTLYLTPTPDDGARFAVLDTSNNLSVNPLTISGNGRLIDGSTSAVFDTDGEAKEYFYRQDTGNWAVLTPLALTDTFPFPIEFDDMFIVLLATRINPRYGAALDDQSASILRRTMSAFKSRYRQHRTMPSEPALIRLPGERRRYYDNSRLANAIFNSGYGFPYNWPYFG